MSEPRVQLGEQETPSASWHDPYSWQPGTSDLPSPSVVVPEEAAPGSLAWLEQGLDELYVSLGGEG